MNSLFARLCVIALLVCTLSYVVWLLSSQQDESSTPKTKEILDTPTTMLANIDKAQVDETVDTRPTNMPKVTLATQISDIAEAYQQSAQYPANSQPITHPHQVRNIAPFEETFTEFPYPSDNYGELKLSVATDQYQYFSGEDVKIIAQLKNAPEDASVQANACLKALETNSEEQCIELTPLFSKHWQFKSAFDSQTLNDNLATELLVQVEVLIDGERFLGNATLRYNAPTATLVDVNDSKPNEEYLDIPLVVDVHQAGYYFVSAVLYDESKNQALVQLQQEARLASGEQKVVLKAHINALKFHNNSGPYQLSSITLRRGAEEGETHDKAGTTNSEVYSVQGFSFDRYLDTPYQDPLALERQQFLRRLSSSSGGQ